MLRKFNARSSLFTSTSNKPIACELEQISRILDETPRLPDLVYRDLVGTKRHDTGRLGLNAEQVLRCAVLKQYRHLSYEEPAFHPDDSSAFRGFSRLEICVEQHRLLQSAGDGPQPTDRGLIRRDCGHPLRIQGGGVSNGEKERRYALKFRRSRNRQPVSSPGTTSPFASRISLPVKNRGFRMNTT